MTTLYRKHRPQLFSEMIGQNHVKLTLQYEISSGKIAHAYLFCGPRGVGKTTMARLFAKSLNCPNRKDGEYEPCDKCPNCIDIREGRSFDMIEIDAASHTGVDNVRENVIVSSRIAPSRSKYKIFIIDEVHMLSLSAFNALLKVLEEPAPNVVFILCTTEAHKVPNTIISRCQRFDFRKIGVKDMVKKLEHIIKLEGIKLDKEILEEVARHSEGHMRDAESLLGQIRAIGGKDISKEEAGLVIPRSDINEVVQIIEFVAKKDAAAALRAVNKILDEGIDLKVFINNILEVGRKLLIMNINPALAESLSMEYGESIELRLRKLNEKMAQAQLIEMINEFSEAKNKIRDANITQLPVEVAIIKLSACMFNGDASGAHNPVKTAKTAVKNFEDTGAELADVESNNNKAYDKNLSDKWNKVIEKIKAHNHSLSFILEVCRPRNLSQNGLILAFKYKFHKDRLNNPKLKSIVEQVISDEFGNKLEIETVLDENMEIENQADGNGLGPAAGNANVTDDKANDAGDNNDLIDNLLKTFGGRVIQ